MVLSVLLNQSEEVIALLGISICSDISALRAVHRGKGFYVKRRVNSMTAAALSCALTSDPHVFESEPVCSSNYSSFGPHRKRVPLLPPLFEFSIPLVFSNCMNATDG